MGQKQKVSKTEAPRQPLSSRKHFDIETSFVHEIRSHTIQICTRRCTNAYLPNSHLKFLDEGNNSIGKTNSKPYYNNLFFYILLPVSVFERIPLYNAVRQWNCF